jgi:GPH family glycoside/pentoside/hexuronide:cation symporter
MATLKEKIGYGFGDMASSMFWKVFSAYLPMFYTYVFGLDLSLAALLFLVTKIWDAVSDPMMGIIADRTSTKWGKYRPYLLWISIPFAISGILLFTTPDLGESGKNVWAFVTYILMMTVYTAINVPYGSMLGVMTEDSDEKTVFSSYRMFFAYTGSFIVLALWEPLCNLFAGATGKLTYDPDAWQWAMIVVGVLCAALFVLTFAMTRERLSFTAEKKNTSIIKDLMSLFRNGPWWILLGGVLFFNFFGAIRYAVIPYYFTTLIGEGNTLSFFSIEFMFYAGIFFTIGEIANMAGVAMATPITFKLGKKSTFLYSLFVIMALCIAFYYVPTSGSTAYWTLLILQIATGIFTGIISPLVWSMYADISDYAELKFKTASTGLIFSSSSMAQKFGGAFGTSAVLWMLAAFGFNTFATQGASMVENSNIVEISFNDDISGLTTDSLTITGDNGYAALVKSESDGKTLKIDLGESIIGKGDYSIAIPENTLARKKDNAPFSGTVKLKADDGRKIETADVKTETAQTAGAIEGIRLLISWIPAGIAALAAMFIFIYPLTTKRMKEINAELKRIRE